jgi:hypothetical protein
MAEWSEMFKSDPGLGIMEQSFSRLKSASQYLFLFAIRARSLLT